MQDPLINMLQAKSIDEENLKSKLLFYLSYFIYQL